MRILEAERLSIAFGGVRAVDEVSLVVEEGVVFSIIGPNGAGKTTLFNLVSGLYTPLDGRVRFAGEDVTGLCARSPRAPRAFTNVPEFTDLFPDDGARKRHGRTPSP